MGREASVDWPWPGEWESVEDVSNFYKDELYEALCSYAGGLAERESHIDYVSGPFTIGNLTIGSVLFASTGGIVSQDNDDFFWDATNIRLGINVGTSPSVPLDVGGDCKFDGAVIINDAGADKDTRIEGLNDTELLFVDASTDRVGISTTAPTTTFNVAGDTDLDGSVIINEANDDKDFRVEGSGATYTHLLFTDASTNRVGINLSSPLCLAHIRGAVCADYAGVGADTMLLIENNDNVAIHLQAATTGVAFIEFCDDNYNPPAGRVGYDFANTQMEFVVETNEHMWLTTTQLKTDLSNFELSGAGAQIKFTGTAGGGDEGVLYKDSGSLARYGLLFEATNKVVLCNRTANGTVELRANTSTAGAGGEVTVVTVDDTDVTLSNGIGLNLQEDITFTGATTVNLIKMPDHLAVALDITEAGNSYLKFVTTNGSESAVFSKKVGIETAPAADLHILSTGALHSGTPSLKIEDSSARPTLFFNAQTDNPQEIVFANQGTIKWWVSNRNQTNDTSQLRFYSAGGDPRLNLNQDGNIGIGTTTPLSTLHIVDDGSQVGVAADDYAATSHGYLTVEDEDARLGLFSRDEGNHGSTVSLVEVNSGTYANHWSIGRLSSTGGSALEIKYGTDPDYSNNTLFLSASTSGHFNFQAGNIATTGTLQAERIGINTAPVSTVAIYAIPPAKGSAGTYRGALIYSPTRDVDDNETTYLIGGQFICNDHNIANTKTDSGYRMGLRGNAYANDANFAGTLTNQYGILFQHGIVSGTGTITNSHGILVESYAQTGTISTLYQLRLLSYLGGTVTTGWGIYQAEATFNNYFAGNMGFGQTTWGTNATQTLALGSGTAPTTSPADCFQMYSADIGAAAGKAGAHFRDEEGNIVSIGSGGILMSGTARVTKCYQFANAALGKGGTKPDEIIVGNYWGWSYDINDDSVLTVKLLDDWAVGTDVLIYIRWAINEAYVTNSGEVRWQATWVAHPADASEAIDDAGTTDNSGDINIPATAYYLTQTLVETIPGASIAAGDELGITIKRVDIGDGSDPTADPVITCVGLVFTSDKLGTPT